MDSEENNIKNLEKAKSYLKLPTTSNSEFSNVRKLEDCRSKSKSKSNTKLEIQNTPNKTSKNNLVKTPLKHNKIPKNNSGLSKILIYYNSENNLSCSTTTAKSVIDNNFYAKSVKQTPQTSKNKIARSKTPSVKSVTTPSKSNSIKKLGVKENLSNLNTILVNKSSRMEHSSEKSTTVPPLSNRQSVASTTSKRKSTGNIVISNKEMIKKAEIKPSRFIKTQINMEISPDNKLKDSVMDISKLITLDYNINEDLFLIQKGDATLLSAFHDRDDDMFGQSVLCTKTSEFKIEFSDILEQMWNNFRK